MFNLEKLHLPFREETAFSLLAFCVFLVPISLSIISYENFESIKFSILLFLVGISGLVWAWQSREVKVVIRANKFIIWLVVFQSLFYLGSCLLAGDKFYSFFGFYYRFTSGFLFYISVLMFAWLCFILITKEKFIYLLKILTFDALLVSLVTILQSFKIIFYAGIETGGLYRGPSLLGNPNYSAMFLACILPLVVYLFANSQVLKAKIYYLIVSLGIVLSVVILASRGALLALIGSLAVGFTLVAFSKINRKLLIKLGLIFLGVMLFSVLVFNYLRPNSLVTITNGQDSNTQSRLFAWKVSGIAIKKHFMFGVGPGNYALFFEKNRTSEIVGNIGVFDDAHNLFLHLTVNSGIPFGLIFILIITIFYYIGVRNYLIHSDKLSLALIVALTVWIISVAFNPVPIPMYLLLILIFSGITLNSNSNEIFFGKAVKYIFIICCVILAYFGLVFAISENLLGLTRNAYSLNDYKKSYNYSRISIALNPTNNLARVYFISSQIHLNFSEEQVKSGIRKIINTHPLQSGTYISSGDLYYLLFIRTNKKEYLQNAIADMHKAIEMDPLFSERYGQLGLYYYQSGDYKNSRISVEKSLQLESRLFPSWILLAKLDQMDNNKLKVIFNLEKALEISPNIPQLKYLIYLAKEGKNIKEVPLDIFIKTPGV